MNDLPQQQPLKHDASSKVTLPRPLLAILDDIERIAGPYTHDNIADSLGCRETKQYDALMQQLECLPPESAKKLPSTLIAMLVQPVTPQGVPLRKLHVWLYPFACAPSKITSDPEIACAALAQAKGFIMNNTDIKSMRGIYPVNLRDYAKRVEDSYYAGLDVGKKAALAAQLRMYARRYEAVTPLLNELDAQLDKQLEQFKPKTPGVSPSV